MRVALTWMEASCAFTSNSVKDGSQSDSPSDCQLPDEKASVVAVSPPATFLRATPSSTLKLAEFAEGIRGHMGRSLPLWLLPLVHARMVNRLSSSWEQQSISLPDGGD